MSIQQSVGKQLHFQDLGVRKIVASFDGGTITSDAGGLLLREVDLQSRVVERFAACFVDRREAGYAEHSVRQLVAQRVYGLCLGYEDLNDHEQLRFDPLFAALCDQADVLGVRHRNRDVGKTLAGKSTLQRLESAPAEGVGLGRYHRIFHNPEAIERFFVEHFLDHYNGGREPGQIIIDLDATDDPIHGNQEGRFFQGFYNSYCYLPLYMFCEGYLLAAKLRRSNIDASLGSDIELERVVAQIRTRWPKTRIIVRGDSGFAREWLMKWCEDHHVEYLFGLARNARLQRAVGAAMQRARLQYASTGRSAKLYEELYCARGEMENRIKEQQLYLFADRTSSATMRANQLRLWFSSVAYVLMHELRQRALDGGEFARAQCHSIRTKLLKIGARVVVSTRRIVVHLASGYPYQDLYTAALSRIGGVVP